MKLFCNYGIVSRIKLAYQHQLITGTVRWLDYSTVRS